MDGALARRLLLGCAVQPNTAAARHLPLVRAVATQVRQEISSRLELDDLIAYGTAGLMEAAGRTDPERDDFEGFARRRVRGAIYAGLREMGQLARPDHARVLMVARARELLDHLAERDDAARAAGAPPPVNEDDLRGLHEALASVTVSFVGSLEALCESGAELASDELLADEALDALRAPGRVRAAVDALPERERHIMERHYFGDRTLTEAAAELGLSKSWASRLHARAIELLRERLG
jgi:RNA polymerase sigma factor for flagellar operon FliA